MNDDLTYARFVEVESGGVEETLELGRRIGGVLEAGDVVGLTGPLGAGKTQLAKGLAGGLQVPDERQVNSPTFVLVNEYEGRLHVYHLDAYRLADVEELSSLGFDEMCDGRGVVIVEWADRVVPAMPEKTLWIELFPTGETTRRLRLRTRSTGIVEKLTAGEAGQDKACEMLYDGWKSADGLEGPS